MKNYSSAVVH